MSHKSEDPFENKFKCLYVSFILILDKLESNVLDSVLVLRMSTRIMSSELEFFAFTPGINKRFPYFDSLLCCSWILIHKIGQTGRLISHHAVLGVARVS